MFFQQIFDDKLAQYAYLVGCQRTGEAIIIDPQRDLDRYIKIAEEQELKIVAATETHIHADYISGVRQCAEQLNAKIYVSDEGDADWKYEYVIGSDYNYQLVNDGDEFKIGNILFKVYHTPGHTPEHIIFQITDLGGGANSPMGLATGDFIFVGDVGRPDLLETAAGVVGAMDSSAKVLFKTIERFRNFDPALQIWPGHGAGSACGKALGAVPMSTMGYEQKYNASLVAAENTEKEFVDFILSGQPEPPMYFARMKRDNRIGPKVAAVPNPKEIDVNTLKGFAGDTSVAVVDTRADRSAFMAGHLPGALYAPVGNTLSTIVGSYVEEETPIYLIVDVHDLKDAVINLYRIGLDNIAGFATLATWNDYVSAGHETATIEVLDFATAAKQISAGEGEGFDVRKLPEFEDGHIPGSVNIAHTRLFVRQSEISDAKLYAYCRTGARAAAASAMLKRHGKNVVYVDDAWASYSGSGAPMAKPEVAIA